MIENVDLAGVESHGPSIMGFCYALSGLYIWEFLSTLDYEWSVIRGRRPYRWTIWIYFTIRLATLVVIILSVVFMSITTQYDCEAALTVQLTFAYLAFAAASLFIVLRIIAIWDKNKYVVGVAITLWLTNVGFFIQGVVRLRSAWAPRPGSCIDLNIQSNAINLVVTILIDIVLLLTMLVGLILLRRGEGGMFALSKLLWNQGILWLFLAIFAELPWGVFVIVNLNKTFNIMYQMPSLLTMAIVTTRLHRSLVDFVSRPTNMSKKMPSFVIRSHGALQDHQTDDFLVPKSKRTPVMQTTLDRMDVTVYTSYGQYPESGSSEHGPWMDMDEHLDDQSDELGIDDERSGEQHDEMDPIVQPPV